MSGMAVNSSARLSDPAAKQPVSRQRPGWLGMVTRQPPASEIGRNIVSVPAPAHRHHDDLPARATTPAQEHDDHGEHEHDLGLSHDLPTLLNRRRLLTLLGGAGAAAALAACGSSEATTASAGSTTS